MHCIYWSVGILLALLLLGIATAVAGAAEGYPASNGDTESNGIELNDPLGMMEPVEGSPSPSVSEQPAQAVPEEHSKWLAVGVASGVALVCIIAISMVEMLRK